MMSMEKNADIHLKHKNLMEFIKVVNKIRFSRPNLKITVFNGS
ncbi:MAG: hypothetical protein PWP18_537 [Thermoanaerobacter sp.]|nr:hypothetical protein [Thermoanaerobacter sp.]